MNIIIVAKPGARPTSLNLQCWRARFQIGAVVAACAAACAAIGFAGALTFANPRDQALRSVKVLHGQIVMQQKIIENL